MKNKFFSIFSILLVLIFSADAFSQSVANLSRSRLSGSSPKKETGNLFQLEKQAFSLINTRRAEAGLPSLIWNEDVAKVARMHSADMAESRILSHMGLDGRTVDKRAELLGVRGWRAIGENIAYNRGFANPCGRAVEAWMKSSGHRSNILNAGWNQTGIGIAVASDGSYYLTQVFLLRR